MSTSGKFKLYVCRDGSRTWGFLAEYLYDDSSRRKRDHRTPTLQRVLKAQMHWVYNYVPFSIASFAIEDWATDFARPVHIHGTKRERVTLQRRVPFDKVA